MLRDELFYSFVSYSKAGAHFHRNMSETTESGSLAAFSETSKSLLLSFRLPYLPLIFSPWHVLRVLCTHIPLITLPAAAAVMHRLRNHSLWLGDIFCAVEVLQV